jgi:hypothetical protein
VDVRVAEEAEVDREEEGRMPPCGDGSDGEAARGRGEARWKEAGVEKTRRAEVERWDRERGESREEIGRAGR